MKNYILKINSIKEDNVMQRFREWLENYLLITGMTNAEFAKKIGVEAALITYYLQGKRRPNYGTLQSIHEQTGVDMNLLFTPPSTPIPPLNIPHIEPVD